MESAPGGVNRKYLTTAANHKTGDTITRKYVQRGTGRRATGIQTIKSIISSRSEPAGQARSTPAGFGRGSTLPTLHYQSPHRPTDASPHTTPVAPRERQNPASLQPRPTARANRTARGASTNTILSQNSFQPASTSSGASITTPRNVAADEQTIDAAGRETHEFAGESNSPNTASPPAPRASRQKPLPPAAACQSGRRC